MGKSLEVVKESVIDTRHEEGEPQKTIAKKNESWVEGKMCRRKRCTSNRDSRRRRKIAKRSPFKNYGEDSPSGGPWRLQLKMYLGPWATQGIRAICRLLVHLAWSNLTSALLTSFVKDAVFRQDSRDWITEINHGFDDILIYETYFTCISLAAGLASLSVGPSFTRIKNGFIPWRSSNRTHWSCQFLSAILLEVHCRRYRTILNKFQTSSTLSTERWTRSSNGSIQIAWWQSTNCNIYKKRRRVKKRQRRKAGGEGTRLVLHRLPQQTCKQ